MQQHYLTADNVLELLKNGVLPNFNQQQQQIFQNLANQHKLFKGSLSNPNTEIPILEQCANYLRSKGIHVYLRITKGYTGNPDYFYFVAGECGRVYERLFELIDRLEFLQLFIVIYTTKLPRKWVSKKKKIDEYIYMTVCIYMPFLEKAYLGDNRNSLIVRCSMCSDYADKVETFLRSLEGLEKAAMLATL
jgi:hypothetical protein